MIEQGKSRYTTADAVRLAAELVLLHHLSSRDYISKRKRDDVATSVDRRLLSNYTSIIIAYSVLNLKVLHTHTHKKFYSFEIKFIIQFKSS